MNGGLGTSRVDVTIVGGGIVGLATAWKLTQRRPDLSIVVIEKETAVAQHQTGHNSGVLHSGIYYKPGSLKARTCTEGRLAMIEFCETHDIGYDLIGKVIVATRTEQLTPLRKLEERAVSNGVTAHRIGPEQLAELEPHSAGIAALHVPGAGIIDYSEVCRRLAGLLVEAGVQLRTDTIVTDISERPDAVRVSVTPGPNAPIDDYGLQSSLVVTCGGLQSDRLARHTNPELAERILPFRGEYYELSPASGHLVNALIYPVPDARFPFLGVHLTKMTNGSVHAGPNAVLALAREGYRWRDIDLGDLAEVARFPGWWKLAAKYWKIGAGEYYRSLSKNAFVTALQELVPELSHADLEPSPAGVRAQAVSPEGDLLDDFVWSESDRIVNVLNAPSPAATASLSIGEQIAQRAEGHL